MLVLLVVSVIGPLILLYLLFEKRPRNFPPGPIRLPILGNLLSFAPSPYISFTKWSKEYGPIVGAKVVTEWTVILHGADLMKEALGESVFSGRPFREGLKYLAGDADGILQAEGESWVEQRRFALRQLRDFGFGRKSMEELISEEVRDIVEWIKKRQGGPVELQRRFSLAMINSLWRILSGERYDHDDEQLNAILENSEKTANALFGSSLKPLIVYMFPGIAKMFPNWSGWNYLVETAQPRLQLFDRIIKEHKETQTDEHSRDFVDTYLREAKKSPGSKQFTDDALKSVMADFFLAGTDTTAVGLSWAMLYLLHNPEVQGKLQAELDRVVGRSRYPDLADRKNLPYAEAVLWEVLRSSSFTYMTLPHRTLADTTLRGYSIPKGTVVFGNLHALHHDPTIWGDPEAFRPERFLSPDGTMLKKPENVLPFSFGPRACPGESLARDTIFLFITALAQNFHITYESEETKPTLEIQFGQLTLMPLNKCSVLMKERHQLIV